MKTELHRLKVFFVDAVRRVPVQFEIQKINSTFAVNFIKQSYYEPL